MFEKFAEDYACSRPGYPAEIKHFLFEQFSITPQSVIADIACGSGIFTQLLSCCSGSGLVVGIDRSLPLLSAGTRFYHDFCFEPICSCGETTPLKSHIVDLVTVAQGFHWMHRQRTLDEIARILKPGGGIGLVWYRRSDLGQPHQDYIERLTHQYNPNYDPNFMDSDYAGMLLDDDRFAEVGQRKFYSSKDYDLETYIKWQRSKSFIGDSMEPDALEEFLREVECEMKLLFPNGIITEEFKYDLIWARRNEESK